MSPGGIPMASYMDLAPFPPSFSPNGLISDHFRQFLDFWDLGDLDLAYVGLFFDKYMSQLGNDTYMGQTGG